MNRAGLSHSMGLNDVYVTDVGKVVFKCYTAHEDASSVTLYYTNKYLNMYELDSVHSIEMVKIASTGEKDVYEVELEIDTLSIRYFFGIRDFQDVVVFYTEEGIQDIYSEDIQAMFDVSQVARNQEVFDIPKWMKEGIVYQIFPERFNRTKSVNEAIEGLDSWYGPVRFNSKLGGTLKGITQKMAYIQSLGATILYLNPIFESRSNHKYDTKDYYEIDPDFGSKEDFKELIREAHLYGMKVVIDGVFNHCGTDFWAFKDVELYGEASEYKDWFYIREYPINRGYKDGKRTMPSYETFGYFGGMPKLNLSNESLKKYVLDVSAYWMNEFEIDGWRLDAADEISHDFWRIFRKHVKQINPEVGIIGEIWYDSTNWLLGDQYDSVMNYKFRKPVTDFVAHRKISASTLNERLQFTRASYKKPVHLGLWNLLGSHDTDRILTLCDENKSKTRLAILLQYTLQGNPVIYYGDEVGMSGANDPDCRRGMYWDESLQDLEVLAYYRKLSTIRKNNPVLIYGEYHCVYVNDERGIIAFKRTYKEQDLLIVINNGEKEFDCVNELDIMKGKFDLLAEQVFNGKLPSYSGVVLQ